MKVAVIGGGYTGLVAALRLAEGGHEVEIFERSEVVGGLASGFEVNGTHLEKAYHHLFKTDTHIINLINELGLSDQLIWQPSSVSIFYNGKIYPFTGATDLLKFAPLNFIDRIRAGLVVLYLQKTKNWYKFKYISAYSWMRKYSGANVVKVIWEPLLRGKFHEYFDKVSMAWLWARLHIRANSRERGGEKLGYLVGGFDILTNALVDRLENLGVKFHLQSEIVSVDTENIKLLNGDMKFDKIISTVPSHVFAKLTANSLSSEEQKKLNSIEYLHAVLLIFTSRQSLSSFYWHNINDIESPFLVFIQHTNLIPKENYGDENVYYIGAYLPKEHELLKLSDDDIGKKWFDYLPKIFPDFDKESISQKWVFRFANAQHVADLNYQEKIPAYKTHLDDVYLANFSQIYPEDRGTNYAVREGEKVAKIVMDDII